MTVVMCVYLHFKVWPVSRYHTCFYFLLLTVEDSGAVGFGGTIGTWIHKSALDCCMNA